MNLLPKITFLTGLFAALSYPVSADQAFDIRQCPVVNVTFVDVLNGDEFRVKRVGVNFAYLCDGNWTKFPINTDACQRFGDLSIVGVLLNKQNNTKKNYQATWSVSKSAPCCGWSFEKQGSELAIAIEKELVFIDPENSPRLGNIGSMVIETDDTEYRLIPVKCR